MPACVARHACAAHGYAPSSPGLTAWSPLACCRAWSPICGSGKIGDRPYTPERDSTRGGTAVTFKEVLAQVIEWLQQDKRLSYRALKRQFALDDESLGQNIETPYFPDVYCLIRNLPLP